MEHDLVDRKALVVTCMLLHQKPHFVGEGIGGYIHFVPAVKIEQIGA